MAAPSDYRPARQTEFPATSDPLEIELVYQVTPCGTCKFFWPEDPSVQPYGPYSAFDFTSDEPLEPAPDPRAFAFPWLTEVTAPPAFPNPEVMDGCRKAPIMTIGINPNMTAFAPGQTGASWCYPNFSSDAGTDLFAKTAYYYRYRSVYQERFDLDFVRKYLAQSPQIVAPKPGVIVSADRKTEFPSFDLKVRYEGDLVDTTIPLVGATGGPQWVVLFDPIPPHNVFNAGDVLAARPDVPAGVLAQLFRQQVGYYEQFVPVLERFQAVLRSDGHPDAVLRMGEDVCQLDMVACASPHWTPDFLGGTEQSEQEIIHNCVTRNHWAIRQLVQTRPAVLFLVGEATYNMFEKAFGGLVTRDVPLSRPPVDGAFTLLSETCDAAHPCELVFSHAASGIDYELRTRLVVTPHFSYSSNFMDQYRLSPAEWQQLQSDDAACVSVLRADSRLTFVPGETEYDYVAFMVAAGASEAVAADITARFPRSAKLLSASLYDPHTMMADVIEQLYRAGAISHGPVGDSSASVLSRTDGACHFCVNEHWSFPLGCPYGKPNEQPPPAGFLRDVAAQMVARGAAAPATSNETPA